MDYLHVFLSSDGFMPHGHCYLWTPALLWLNVVADLLIGFSYLSIPCTLVYFIRKKHDVPFNWMFIAFGTFILACGATHFMDVWTTWNPDYWLLGYTKGITAAASVPTAILLVKLVPKALLLPSAQQLADVNAALQKEISARKRFEQVLQERSAKIAEGNRAKSEFLANMSHELRTPLNGIIGFSEFLVDEKPGKLNEKQKEYLNDVLNSGRHLMQLINDVLDLSKVEAGKMELFPETFNLSKAVEEACTIVSPLANKKNITIRTEIAPMAGGVTLDRQKFKQVLHNLLSNAVKFTDNGGRVDVITDMYESNRLRLHVRDTGIGIKLQDLGKLFVEFQQIDSGTSRRYEGTGLGLALTKKIVEFQHGTITVESEPGKGSTFTVILPLNLTNDPEPRQA